MLELDSADTDTSLKHDHVQKKKKRGEKVQTLHKPWTRLSSAIP